MSKPFEFIQTVYGPIKPHPRKPGWHKRGLAAERAAASKRTTVAPQRGDSAADAKAVEYAMWLAKRDGVALPGGGTVRWEACAAGMRPRYVDFSCKGAAPVQIELPHWSYVAPEAVEIHAADWTAPIVAEVTGDARVAVLAALEEHDAAVWCEAVAGAYAAPVAWEITDTDPEAELVQEVHTLPAPMFISAPTIEAEKMNMPAATHSEMELVADTWEPTAETHPVIALALSHKARETLFATVLDGTFPAETGKAAAGAWRVTLEDAKALHDVGSIRLVGMPRKPYTRRAAAPVVSSPAIHVTAYGGLTISHHGDRAAVYHSPSL